VYLAPVRTVRCFITSQLTKGMNPSRRSWWVGFKFGMCFLPMHQGFKACEINSSAHQKYEPRQRLQSGSGLVWSGAVWCCLVFLIVIPVFNRHCLQAILAIVIDINVPWPVYVWRSCIVLEWQKISTQFYCICQPKSLPDCVKIWLTLVDPLLPKVFTQCDPPPVDLSIRDIHMIRRKSLKWTKKVSVISLV